MLLTRGFIGLFGGSSTKASFVAQGLSLRVVSLNSHSSALIKLLNPKPPEPLKALNAVRLFTL